MITSVFLSNNTVFVVCGEEGGKPSAGARSIIYRMPEGSLLNGMITNEQELTEQLGELWRKESLPKKDVRLVLESSRFSVKTLRLPRMKRGEIPGVIEREFADIEQYEARLYDYALLKEFADGGQDTLAVMVENSYIESWRDIFAGIGVTLSRITVSREAMTRYFASCDGLREGAYVLLLLDDTILTSVLWSRGRMVSADRKRMFSDVGSPEFYTEIARSVSSIRQFYMAQKVEAKLSKVYLCGFGPEDVKNCQENLDGFGLDMEVEQFKEPCADNVMAAGGLLAAKKPIDMLQRLREQEKAEKSLKFPVKKVLPLLVLSGVCAAATVVLILLCSLRMGKAASISEYLTDEERLSKKFEVELLNSEIGSMERLLREAGQVREKKDSYPNADSEVTDRILAAAEYDMDVRIESYDASTGELQMSVSTPLAEDVNRYISTLKDTGMFVDVDYAGYGYSENDGRYQGKVNGILKGDAGK